MKIGKTLFAVSVAAALQICASIGFAGPDQAYLDVENRLDALFLDLQQVDPENWQPAETEIIAIWHDTGSAAMDFLFERGMQALENGDYAKAIAHLSALIDHAPEFAEAWNARAKVYFTMHRLGQSIADIRQTLIRNPRHFWSLNGLGIIYEELGNPKAALAAYLAAQAIHPHIQDVNEAIMRLQTELNGVTL
ncbi:MAG: tetratricopeptide repeat protein [Paracoccaceae bacterium]